MTSSDGLVSPAAGAPLEVLLNVYDVAQGDIKGTVVRLNNLVGPKGLGLGGVFHGAIVLGTVELSFGFCEQGTGVYAVKAGQNPMYTFRETVDLGPTSKSMVEIRSIIRDMKQEWPGASYDLLHRNCCHFCVDLASRLGVAPVPGWLNRFASGAAATITMTQDTVKTVQDFGLEVGRLWNKTLAAASQQQQQIADKLQQQQQHWRSHHQQQQQQHQQHQQQRSSFTGLRGGGPLTPRSAQIADSAAQAGQQLWSGLTQAGLQLKATTSRLAQAAAAKTSNNSTPRPSSSSSSSSSSYSSRHGNSAAGEALLGGQQQQGSTQGRWAHQGTAAAAAAGAGAAAAVVSSLQGGLAASDRSMSAAVPPLLLGAQPKLSKEYRLSSAGSSQLAAAAATDGAGMAAANDSGSNGGALQSFASDDTLMPFLSVDDVDPFVALVGEDDGEDDAQQKAAVECALQHGPAAAAVAVAVPSQ